MDARSAAACRCWCVAWVHPCISAGDGDCTSTTRDPLHSSTRCASAGALWGLAPLPRGGGGGGGGGAGEAITACTPPPPPQAPPSPRARVFAPVATTCPPPRRPAVRARAGLPAAVPSPRPRGASAPTAAAARGGWGGARRVGWGAGGGGSSLPEGKRKNSRDWGDSAPCRCVGPPHWGPMVTAWCGCKLYRRCVHPSQVDGTCCTHFETFYK